eukprot:TRINITY_DN74803_c0_g1_i1.p1 TRINITY_DN74803_c0_g1~~TRINITY_DN74803_c0_g1_i1.p1  ORF type:complete len:153 (-),score=31.13 TRINITY_DN74803_c0_g1_i1:235-693(-)
MAHRRSGGSPPQSFQWTAQVLGQKTDFVITDFGSELFFVITQSAKIGSFVQATASEPKQEDALDESGLSKGERTHDVQVLFGDRRAEHYRSYARALIELVASRCSKSVLLGIHLKEHSMEGFRVILKELRERIAPVTTVPDEDDDDAELLER